LAVKIIYNTKSIMKNIIAIVSTFAVLLCVANAQAGGGPDCCMMACCVKQGQYKCHQGANTCFMGGQKFTSGPRCGPGNNGVVCKKPAKPLPVPSGNSSNVCGTGCLINGKCEPQEKCKAFINNMVKMFAGFIWLVYIIGCCCCCGCLFGIYFCCCGGRNGRGRQLSITARQPGQSYVNFTPNVAVAERVETGDNSYMQMK
jgi:hypothetical protein